MRINVGQVLFESASFYKKYFKKLAGISLGMASASLVSTAYTYAMEYMQTTPNNVPLWLALFSIVILVAAILSFIIVIKLSLAMPILTNALFDENGMTAKQAFGQTKGKFWTIIRCSLLVGILYMPSIAIMFSKIPFASVIGTIYIAFISALFYTLVPMIAVEPKTNRYLSKSAKMIKGNYIPILLLTFITVTALAVINGALIYLFQGKEIALLIVRVSYNIVYFFTYPFAGITSIFVYRQLKTTHTLDSTEIVG